MISQTFRAIKQLELIKRVTPRDRNAGVRDMCVLGGVCKGRTFIVTIRKATIVAFYEVASIVAHLAVL